MKAVQCLSAWSLTIPSCWVLCTLCWNAWTKSLGVDTIMGDGEYFLFITFKSSSATPVVKFFWATPHVQCANKWQSTWVLIALSSPWWACHVMGPNMSSALPALNVSHGISFACPQMSPRKESVSSAFFRSFLSLLASSELCHRFQRGFQLIA